MLFRDEDPKTLPDPVPKRAEVMIDEGKDDVETPVPMLERVLMESPTRPPEMSLERLDETMG